MRKVEFAILSALALQGCATVSFSPPSVNLANAMQVRGSNRSVGQQCKPFETVPDPQDRSSRIKISQDVNGARYLIDNFIFYYRCAAHSAANGRQIFEIPSFLTTVGTVTATALGAGSNVAIAGGSAVAILNGSKNYYAPREKADIYDGALDALLCIKLEAIGIDGFEIAKFEAAQGVQAQAMLAAADHIAGVAQKSGAGLATGAGKQFSENGYFDLVAASLFSVERVLAQRLSAVGIFDPAGVTAEIEKLSKAVEDEQSPEAKKEADAKAATLGGDKNVQMATSKTIVDLASLRPKLQKCVVRAKL